MTAPVRSYFYLDEIADAWNLKSWDIDHMIENGQMRVHVALDMARVVFGFFDTKENAEGYWGSMHYDVGPLEDPEMDYTADSAAGPEYGLFMLFPKDVEAIVRQGMTHVHFIDDRHDFDFIQGYDYCRFDEPDGRPVRKSDLVVSPEERARCEDLYGFGKPQTSQPDRIPLSVYGQAFLHIAKTAWRRRA